VKSTSYEAPHYAVFSRLSPLSPFIGPNFLLRTLFSNILSVTDQVPYLYKTTRKLVILHVLIFTFIERRWEIKRF
jgi:hypothetical protein